MCSARVVFALLCLVVPAASAAAGRLRSSHAKGPSYESWSPPPEYASKTWGHKTMYLANVSIGSGSARQSFRMLIDTGSWLVVVPGAACQQLGCSGHRHFDTRDSTGGNRTASVSFAHGSVAGRIFSDTVCAGPRFSHLQEVGFLQRSAAKGAAGEDGSTCAQMSFLVAEQESADFADAPFDGILGLGLQRGGPDSGVGNSGGQFSFLSQLVAQGRLPNSVFALRLGDDGKSELIFGDVDESSLVGGKFLWVPVSSASDGHWQISISDLTLDGARQNVGEMEVIVDSGTSLLAPDEGLMAWFTGKLSPRDCSNVNALPKLGLRLRDGATLTMLPSDYIDRIDGKCTLSVMPLNVSGAAHSTTPRLILGDSFLRRFTTAFDVSQRRLGFGMATGADQGKELVEAMFPSMSPESLESVPVVPDVPVLPVVQDLEAGVPGLAGHLTVARMQRQGEQQHSNKPMQPKDVVEKAASSDDTMQEQAGYDFARHLWERHASKHNVPDQHLLLRRKKEVGVAVGHSTEDNLKAAGDKLDSMLNELKVAEDARKQAAEVRDAQGHANVDSISWWPGVAAAADTDVKRVDEAAEAVAQKKRLRDAPPNDKKEPAVGSIHWWAHAKAQHIRRHVGISRAAGAQRKDAAAGSIHWWAHAKAHHIRRHVGIKPSTGAAVAVAVHEGVTPARKVWHVKKVVAEESRNTTLSTLGAERKELLVGSKGLGKKESAEDQQGVEQDEDVDQEEAKAEASLAHSISSDSSGIGAFDSSVWTRAGLARPA